MRDQTRALPMFLKTRAEADAFVRAFDQAGDISHDKRASLARCGIGIGGNHTQMWLQRGERIRRDLWTRRRDTRNQRGFSSVREADQAYVRKQFQFKPQREFFTGFAIFVFPRSLMPGPYEMGIAVAASTLAAASCQITLARLGQIEKLLVAIQIENNGADGNFEYQIIRGLAGAIGAFAMTAAAGFEFAIVTISQQGIVVRIGFDVDVAALAAISARRAAARDVLLPAKRDAAVAAVAGFDGDFCFIRKHGSPDLESLEESICQGWEQKQKYAPWRAGRVSENESLVGCRGLCCGRRAVRAADRGFFRREHADELAVRALIFEAHDARNGGEQAVVFRAADVLAGLVARAALANQNAAAAYQLAAETLDAQPLSMRIASVCGRAAALFMCHSKPLRNLNIADFDRSVMLPVAALDIVLTARLVLQSEHLRPAILGDDFADDFCLGNVCAGSEFLVVVADGEHFIESNLAADFALEPLDANGLAGLDAILLSPSANYGVHAAS